MAVCFAPFATMSEPERAANLLELVRGRQTPEFVVVDDQLRVIFRAGESEAPALTPALETAIRRLMQRLNASGDTSAVAVLSPATVVRLLRLASRAGDPHFAVFLERFATRNAIEKAVRTYGLSVREAEVLERLMRGDSTNEIARELRIGATTVQEHIRKIGRKTHVTKRSAIVAKVFGVG